MKSQLGYTLPELLLVVYLILIVAGGIGWIWNIVKLIDTCCGITGMLVVRAIGIFVPPLGAVMGYL
jgi:prepilin-type N-terminal cleavage/methylation domain-containing protein